MSLVRCTALATLLTFAAASAPAVADPGASSSLDAMMAMNVEIVQIETELQKHQEAVMARPKVVAEQQRVQGLLIAEMNKIEPTSGALLERLQAMEPALAAAEEGTDAHRGLVMEAVTLASQLETIEQRARQEPQVIEAIAAFDELVYAEIGVMDASLAPMVARRAELIEARAKLPRGE